MENYGQIFTEEELQNEVWKDIKKYKGLYQVSNLGRVKSLDKYAKSGRGMAYHFYRSKILKPNTDRYGYKTVTLCKNSTNKPFGIHTLVLTNFIRNKKYYEQCRHLDGSKNNNRVENLWWGTVKQNTQDKFRHGTNNPGSKSSNHIIDEKTALRIRILFGTACYTFNHLAKKFELNRATITDIVRGRSWKHVRGILNNHNYKKLVFLIKLNNLKIKPDQKEHIQELLNNKKSISKIAKIYNVSADTINRFIKNHKLTKVEL